MKINRMVLIAAVAAAIVVVLVLGNRSGSGGPEKLDVAVNLPLSGPLSVYGISVREGVEQYLSDTPDAASRLSFDWQDNASDPAAAVRIAARQLEGAGTGPDIYVSGVKPQTMAIAGAVEQSGIPHFVWIFDPFLRATGANNFRTWVSYKIEPQVYLEFVEKRDAESVAVAYVQLPHTVEEFEMILFPEFDKREIDYTTEVFEFGRTDFREIARNLIESEADVIILNGFQLELAAMVRAMRQEQGYDASKIIGTYDMLDAADVLSSEELEGISVVTPVFSTVTGRSENAEWINRFTEQQGKGPLYTHAFAYDMAQLLDRVSQSENTNLKDMIQNMELQGVTGTVSFDADGDLVTPLAIGRFQNGDVIAD